MYLYNCRTSLLWSVAPCSIGGNRLVAVWLFINQRIERVSVSHKKRQTLTLSKTTGRTSTISSWLYHLTSPRVDSYFEGGRESTDQHEKYIYVIIRAQPICLSLDYHY